MVHLSFLSNPLNKNLNQKAQIHSDATNQQTCQYIRLYETNCVCVIGVAPKRSIISIYGQYQKCEDFICYSTSNVGSCLVRFLPCNQPDHTDGYNQTDKPSVFKGITEDHNTYQYNSTAHNDPVEVLTNTSLSKCSLILAKVCRTYFEEYQYSNNAC
jgi:hypothetical protein